MYAPPDTQGPRLYNKLFTKILDSSIWLEADATRIVWFTMLAAMDQDGFVQFASVANLAHRARVDHDAAKTAVAVLEGPDENSSDPDHDGRRIERVPGGWMVLNSEKYKELATREHQRQQTKQRSHDYRERHAPSRSVTPASRSVTPRHENVTPSETETETQAYAQVKTPPTPLDRGVRVTRDHRKHAREVVRLRFGCRHEPRCANHAACVEVTARELAEKAS